MTDTVGASRRTVSARFYSLEMARGLAAIMVAMVHATHMMSEPRYLGHDPLGGATDCFWAAVDFFFVLSGFIICWVNWPDVGQPDRLPRYAERRFLRIFPLYWAVIFPLVAVYSTFPSLGGPATHNLGNILASVFLLPSPLEPVLGVTWTLSYEVMFYIAFGAMIRLGRRWCLLFPLWGTAVCLTHILGWAPPFPASILLNPHVLEFLAGSGAALVLRRWTVPQPWLLAGLGLGGFATGLATMQSGLGDMSFTLIFGSSSTVMVLGLVELERSGAISLNARVASFMGASSYAVYIVHVVAESAAARPLMHLSTLIPGKALTLLLMMIGICAGIVAHVWIERPLMRIFRHLIGATSHFITEVYSLRKGNVSPLLGDRMQQVARPVKTDFAAR